MAAPPTSPEQRILSLDELRRQCLSLRPAALHVGVGVSIALSQESLGARRFFVVGLELARSHRLIDQEQFARYERALASDDVAEQNAIGGFIESKLRPRENLFAEWLRESVGALDIVDPSLALPIAAAAQQGILISTTNYDRLLSEATGLPHLTWQDFRSIEQLQSPPTLLHLDGTWDQPASVVLAVRRDSQAARHREAIQTYLGALRFLLLVGVGHGFLTSTFAQAIQGRRGTLPVAILCRQEDVPFFEEQGAQGPPWFQLAPYSGGFAALALVLEQLFGTVPSPTLTKNAPPSESATASSREPRILVKDAGSEVLDLAFGHLDHEERIITAHADGRIRIWEGHGQQTVGPEDKPGPRIWCAATHSRYPLAAYGNEDGSLQWLDLRSMNFFSTPSSPKNCCWSLASSTLSNLMAVARDSGHVEIWAPSGSLSRSKHLGAPFIRYSNEHAHAQGALAVAFSPDGETLASAGHDRAIRFWSVADLKPLRAFEGHTDWVGAIAFSPDGRTLASTGGDKTVILWDVESGTALWRAHGHTEWVQSLSFHNSGRLIATGSWDKSVRVWDAATGALLHSFQGHTERVWTVAFSPDGLWLASGGDDRTIRLWPIDVDAARPAVTIGSIQFGTPIPEAFRDKVHALASTPERLSLFLARLTHRHREGVPLLESLEPGQLRDALRPTSLLDAPNSGDFARQVLELEKSLGSTFQPPPLWLAWMKHVRLREVMRLGQELIALAEHAQPATDLPPNLSVLEPEGAESVSDPGSTESVQQLAIFEDAVQEEPLSEESESPKRPPSKAPVKKQQPPPPRRK